jgi:hypothetical protein
MSVRITKRVDRGTERRVGAFVDVDQPRQRGGDSKVEPVALGIEWVGNRLLDVVARRRGEPRCGGRIDRPAASRCAAGH